MFIVANKHRDSRAICDGISSDLALFSSINARLCGAASHKSGAIAWEASVQCGGYGEWTGDEIKEVKVLVANMLSVAEAVTDVDEETDIYRIAARIMAAFLTNL